MEECFAVTHIVFVNIRSTGENARADAVDVNEGWKHSGGGGGGGIGVGSVAAPGSLSPGRPRRQINSLCQQHH